MKEDQTLKEGFHYYLTTQPLTIEAGDMGNTEPVSYDPYSRLLLSDDIAKKYGDSIKKEEDNFNYSSVESTDNSVNIKEVTPENHDRVVYDDEPENEEETSKKVKNRAMKSE